MNTLWLIVPVKSLSGGKSRLADVLGPTQRRLLNRRFLDHVLAAAAEFPGADSTVVVSGDAEALEVGRARNMAVIEEAGDDGLNAALTQARTAMMIQGERDLLIVPADLPAVSADDLRAMCRPPIAIAPDEAATGTNALFVAKGQSLDFHFGEGSFSRHCEEARAGGLDPVIVNRPGLAIDIDTPEDYARLIATPGQLSPDPR